MECSYQLHFLPLSHVLYKIHPEVILSKRKCFEVFSQILNCVCLFLRIRSAPFLSLCVCWTHPPLLAAVLQKAHPRIIRRPVRDIRPRWTRQSTRWLRKWWEAVTCPRIIWSGVRTMKTRRWFERWRPAVLVVVGVFPRLCELLWARPPPPGHLPRPLLGWCEVKVTERIIRCELVVAPPPKQLSVCQTVIPSDMRRRRYW